MDIKTDKIPYQGKDTTVGQFVIVYGETEGAELCLMDDERNRYPMDQVSILSSNFSQTSGNMDLPKPFRIDNEGKILENGAKVLIIFPFGRRHPVVTGCIKSFACESTSSLGLRFDPYNVDKKVSRTSNDDYYHDITLDKYGLREVLSDISKSVSIEGGNLVESADNITLEGRQSNNILGYKVEIGGNGRRVGKIPDDYVINKAVNANIYSKKICLGHSNDRGQKIEIDTETKYLEPKMQKAVMGITLKVLLDKLIDLLTNAMYMGNGVMVQMSITDKRRIERQVKEKLPLILSEVVTLMCKGDQVE